MKDRTFEEQVAHLTELADLMSDARNTELRRGTCEPEEAKRLQEMIEHLNKTRKVLYMLPSEKLTQYEREGLIKALKARIFLVLAWK